MEIPKEVSIERALNRYRDNHGKESEYGRYVPISIIDNFFDSGDDGFQAIKKDVDGYIKIDSLTGKIIEKGGEPIPETRSYAKAFEEVEEAEIKELDKAPDNLKTDLENSLKGAKIALKYAEKSEKTEIRKFVKGLQISIKYLK